MITELFETCRGFK